MVIHVEVFPWGELEVRYVSMYGKELVMIKEGQELICMVAEIWKKLLESVHCLLFWTSWSLVMVKFEGPGKITCD